MPAPDPTPRPVDARVVLKIRKCLALAGSSEPHEAAAALRQAQALMRRHGIAEDDPRLVVESAIGATGSRAITPPAWLNHLVQLVAEVFAVRPVFRTGRSREAEVEWIGRTPRPAIACYAFEVLARQLRRDRARWLSSHRRGRRVNRIRRADAFAMGWVDAVSKRVERLAEGIPSDELVGSFLAARGDKLVIGRARSRGFNARDLGAVIEGIEHGRRAALHHGVRTGLEPERLAAE